MWSWLLSQNPCKTGNNGWLPEALYQLYEFVVTGTGGCPCCTFFRGFGFGSILGVVAGVTGAWAAAMGWVL